MDGDIGRARALGLSLQGLRRLQGLMAEHGRNSWDVGDVLVEVYGTPPAAGVIDGSRDRLGLLAGELGCSLSWLTACRITSAAWPRGATRRAVARVPPPQRTTGPHRRTGEVPERLRQRGGVPPSLARLVEWLDAQPAPLRRAGRPRLDPVVRVERLALALDHDSLARLVEPPRWPAPAAVA